MKYSLFLLSGFLFTLLLLSGCNNTTNKKSDKITVRQPVDTVGFAQYGWQMDSIMARIDRDQGKVLNDKLAYSSVAPGGWKVAVSPHDDYAYVGYMYPAVLKNIKAKTVIIFGVAHKAKKLHLEDKVIFDNYDYWKEPYGNVKVSDLREDIIKNLPAGIYEVNDSMQKIEHSVEAIIPFLQYYNRDVEIVSILVPYMSFKTMNKIAEPLARAIKKAVKKRKWQWGKDFAIVISTDAVHYGDEEWGGKNFAFNGTGCKANEKTKIHEYEIIKTISGPLSPEGIENFTKETLDKDNFREYKWTWCGRYSVPLGLLTAYYLNGKANENPLTGTAIGYSNSIDHPQLDVQDIGMGTTAPAHDHHWVGYAGIGYN